jgi:hypothetical protein
MTPYAEMHDAHMARFRRCKKAAAKARKLEHRQKIAAEDAARVAHIASLTSKRDVSLDAWRSMSSWERAAYLNPLTPAASPS